jgi:hypothetical protein
VAVARAYVDQLTRSKGISRNAARAVKTALDKPTGCGPDRSGALPPSSTSSTALATQLEGDAGAAAGATGCG